MTTEADGDADGLNDWRELVAGTLATSADTDADGVNDSNEFANVLFGLDPKVANNLQAILQSVEQRGKDAVVANPGAFSLYTSSSIQDLRGAGNLMFGPATNNKVMVRLPLEKSSNLGTWSPAGDLMLEMDTTPSPSRQFFRLAPVPNE